MPACYCWCHRTYGHAERCKGCAHHVLTVYDSMPKQPKPAPDTKRDFCKACAESMHEECEGLAQNGEGWLGCICSCWRD